MTGIGGDKRDLVFPGFPDFRANVTFVPIQFFTIVLPTSSRGTVRIVAYALRRLLGWVDSDGNPRASELLLSYRELVENAGVSRDSIAEALSLAVERRFLVCIEAPRPDTAGQPGQSGTYAVCWDNVGPYTDSPKEFKGFYYPEAAVVEESKNGRVVSRPKAARKNIPNVFFDYLIPREPLSVIRVVGALLFYSIQWGPGGERKQPVSRSITELSRLARMSRRHVFEAVKIALSRGYIEQIDSGHFDPAAGETSRSACYGIRWSREVALVDSHAPPVRKGERGFSDRSERVNGQPVGKGARNRSEKVNGEESEKVNGISIKKEHKKETAAAAVCDACAKEGERIPTSVAFESLISAGFDAATSRQLAERYPIEVIKRQIEWITLRSSTRNKLGLLRRAIEQDWPKPEAAKVTSESETRARIFASHYYAAYHGYKGDAGTEAFGKDIESAEILVERLLTIDANEKRVPEWGRQFGLLIRGKHQGDARARPNLSIAIVLFGDQFLTRIQQERSSRQDERRAAARAAHQVVFASAYRTYLRNEEARLRENHPILYEAFLKQRDEKRRQMTAGPIVAPASWLAAFDAEDARLEGLAAYFSNHPQYRILGFWEWDRRLNPAGFGARIQGEVHA